jgi:hypothetical protein
MISIFKLGHMVASAKHGSRLVHTHRGLVVSAVRKHLRSDRAVLALPPKSLPINEEYVGKGSHDQGKKCQEGRRPVIVQFFILLKVSLYLDWMKQMHDSLFLGLERGTHHLDTEQRECCGKRTSSKRVGRECRCGV